MEKEKEIKRMEFIISSTVHECEQKDCIRNCQFARQKDCKFFRAAKDLQGEGYGDVRAAVKEFAARIKGALPFIVGELEPSFATILVMARIDDIVREVCGGDESNDDRLR